MDYVAVCGGWTVYKIHRGLASTSVGYENSCSSFSLERNLFAFLSFLVIDCLQFAFSLKIRLVLISASAIANHDVMLQ